MVVTGWMALKLDAANREAPVDFRKDRPTIPTFPFPNFGKMGLFFPISDGKIAYIIYKSNPYVMGFPEDGA
jgi:hypothetical protein|nr:MAG TPA_asm: hypothetical protein [Caudoviricetes sp.]